ncbi:helicase-related protein [Desulfoferula mesophila]|uniref:Helicase C-terminal domain-containing protein n=1 Tax=Desulfoferula mesophila TaxID=3058419 RepID=A0AAU9EEZ2_9BACT|nr:hypothetical protein FAK_01950 [Desulfoferula mesophilus]
MREQLLTRLMEDLIGPHEEEEVLTSKPADVYLSGILWPRDTRMTAEDDEKFGTAGFGDEEGSEAGEEEEISLVGLARPRSAGVSLAASSPNGVPSIEVRVLFATYEPIDDDPDTKGGALVENESSETERLDQQKSKWPRLRWHRRWHDLLVRGLKLNRAAIHVDLKSFGAPQDVKLYLRTAPFSEGTLTTVTIINDASPDKDGGRRDVERLTLFQTKLEIRPENGTYLVARPSRRMVLDEEDLSGELLYREAKEFAVGHTCSAEWEEGDNPGTASKVTTHWMPRTLVSSMNPEGSDVFNKLLGGGFESHLSTDWLAEASAEELGEALSELPIAYGEWISQQESLAQDLEEKYRAQAKKNLKNCRKIQDRMAEGAVFISSSPELTTAFRLANKAMSLQHKWNVDKASSGPLRWWPFQLGFILLAASSVADRNHPERGIMDLLWFPTGGGKTEAYLGLIAFLAFYRRLASGKNPDDGAGVAAIMRYTLRLLTTQQFVRAAAVMLACEAIRRGCLPGFETGIDLGKTPFSIGLWVGNDAVPNKVADAAAALGGADQPTPKQLVECPACRKDLVWQHNSREQTIQVKCQNEGCILYDPETALPIWTVDEDVYRFKPTLLIGTIDKFAQIVRRKEVNALLGLSSGQPPDLIVQDELHLISGPLGTIAGLYEVAIDKMFSSRGGQPKIIGSTATIRRAGDQVKALFNRETEQFPPPGLNADDTGFAVKDEASPGRLYCGITTAGRSAKFTLQAVAASLLQSASEGTGEVSERDPYWTLVSYFNSLRELGGALVLMQDDVNDSMEILAGIRSETSRKPELVEELTSRRTQAEVRDMLSRLEIPAGSGSALDVVLATNMLSVGVDIPRLGLMLMNGQPKGIAEYIQATSRVGRGIVPGLVVVILNNAKARDRSHYETFATWHSTLYRDVEPTSVTPFASRARDRALHAILVALVRHLVPGMLERPALDDRVTADAEDIIDQITQRAKFIDPSEVEVLQELKERLANWKRRAPSSYWGWNVKKSLLQDAERAATMRAMGRMPGDAWPTLNNMRNVEASTRFILREFLHQNADQGGENG